MGVGKYDFCSSQEVDSWLEDPHQDSRIAGRIQRRTDYVLRRIEVGGPAAGDDYFEKLDDDLWEIKVFRYRIFSTIRGSTVLMAMVLEKKKGRLSRSVLDLAQQRVNDFVASVDPETCT